MYTACVCTSLTDPNVEVVYVSPRPVDQEVLDYYHKLLALGNQRGGAAEKEEEESRQRIHIVTPEHAGEFSHHNLSLSTELLYSPQALRRIQHLTAGREAYIVPGVVNRDDIAVADLLGETHLYRYYNLHVYQSSLSLSEQPSHPIHRSTSVGL